MNTVLGGVESDTSQLRYKQPLESRYHLLQLQFHRMFRNEADPTISNRFLSFQQFLDLVIALDTSLPQ